ncbi:MAG: tyrosine-type recombinase/integrase, partial [Gammaproteobacteria bacterium]|nr:tyrosine-type recombinase/integrase [Gammaproteobacteria bacterium]
VDFQRNVLRLGRTASQFGRTVPLVGHPLRVMRSYYRAHGRESHLVFPSSGGGRSPARLRQAWNTAIGHSGIADFGFKDLRHCAAAYLAENGGTLTDIAELLGHNTLHAVQRYAHLVVPRTAHAVTKVSTGIFEQLPRRA